jgi:ubiquinone/menaquinone biosynthesis C-methylase UbiE
MTAPVAAANSCDAGAAALAFERIAESYDAIFTRTTVGRAQRDVVWDALSRAFSAGDHVLELNCGTGEDALFLNRRGVAVTACDVSPAMIAVAQRRLVAESRAAQLEFRVLANEELQRLRNERPFDGAFSNFSGLNCVSDLRGVAANLGALLKPGTRLLICLSTRFCLWETVWYLARGQSRKAFRRWSGHSIASVEGARVAVWYPTLRQIRRQLTPWFQVQSVRAVGLLVPPSYAEDWAERRGTWIRAFAKFDRAFGRLPILRGIGDHVLFEAERVPS